jgi:hypothetical protein
VRRLYDLTVRHRGSDLEQVATHLDLDEDEVKLRDLLFDACRRNGDGRDRVGDYTLTVRDHGNRYEDLLVYVTTEVS